MPIQKVYEFNSPVARVFEWAVRASERNRRSRQVRRAGELGGVMKVFFVLMKPLTGMMLKKQMGKLKALVESGNGSV